MNEFWSCQESQENLNFVWIHFKGVFYAVFVYFYLKLKHTFSMTYLIIEKPQNY